MQKMQSQRARQHSAAAALPALPGRRPHVISFLILLLRPFCCVHAMYASFFPNARRAYADSPLQIHPIALPQL